jgi:hypothetical protein
MPKDSLDTTSRQAYDGEYGIVHADADADGDTDEEEEAPRRKKRKV